MHRCLNKVFDDRHVRKEVELLKDHAHGRQKPVTGLLIRILCRTCLICHREELAFDLNRTRVDFLQAIDTAKKRRLARAGRADDGEDFAAPNGKVNAL